MRWPFGRAMADPPPPAAPPLPDLWAEVLTKDVERPPWPLIVHAPLWERGLKPWFQGLLTQTIRELVTQRDPEILRALQIRALLLEGLLTQPYREMDRLAALRENQYQAGGDPLGGEEYAGRR